MQGMFLCNFLASVETCMHRCTKKSTLQIIPDLLTFDIPSLLWMGMINHDVWMFHFLCNVLTDVQVQWKAGREEIRGKQTEKRDFVPQAGTAPCKI